jgi:uncharacterized protein involved in response to NO
MSILQLGFRTFYSLAAIFAIAAMLLWLRAFTGLSGTGDYLYGVVWHSHEMLFGFSVAVITGFLLTAVRNWTGLPTPVGVPLAMLAMLWLAARVLILMSSPLLAAIVDVAFLPVLALAIAVPILRSKNKRNYKVLGIVLALALSHGVFHLASLGYLDAGMSRTALFVGIDIVIVLLATVAGRVIPAFTRNAVPNATSRHEPWVEVVSFASIVLIIFVSVLRGYSAPASGLMAVLFLIAAAAHAIRLALWEPIKTLHNPLLWMMPVAYSWIPFAFFLRALTSLAVVPASAWVHAITTGAVSGFMLAMMMRSSLGHTGRQLVASKADMTAFLLLQLAAIVRVAASIVAGETYQQWVVASGLIWALAFLVFVSRYLPMLSRPGVSDQADVS